MEIYLKGIQAAEQYLEMKQNQYKETVIYNYKETYNYFLDRIKNGIYSNSTNSDEIQSGITVTKYGDN
jgi:hypothetical protein